METMWTIISGGRLRDHHLTAKTLFRFSTDERFDDILLTDQSIKKSFEEKLRKQLVSRGLYSDPMAQFVIEYTSQTVDLFFPCPGKHLELSIAFKHIKTNSIVWYFVMLSPEKSVSQHRMTEIIDQLLERLPITRSTASRNKIIL